MWFAESGTFLCGRADCCHLESDAGRRRNGLLRLHFNNLLCQIL